MAFLVAHLGKAPATILAGKGLVIQVSEGVVDEPVKLIEAHQLLGVDFAPLADEALYATTSLAILHTASLAHGNDLGHSGFRLIPFLALTNSHVQGGPEFVHCPLGFTSPSLACRLRLGVAGTLGCSHPNLVHSFVSAGTVFFFGYEL